MNVRKFSANTSREAIRLVRDALGSDAVILSNRNVDGRVEILVMADEVVSSLVTPEHKKVMVPDVPRFTPRFTSDDSPQQYTANNIGHFDSEMAPQVSPGEISAVMNEIRSMRGMLEAQLAELSWTHTQKRQPKKAEILREMLATGFSASLSRFLIEKMPESDNVVSSLDWIKAILNKNLSTISNESEILEKGGVYALIGPTGVGKTTTTAKLAARCVMRHGPAKLALITTDGYRIGGYEQLRIYGKILGVMVHSVKDESDLRIALSELKNKHTVLIDTVGVSQRDKMVAEQIAMLSGADSNVKRLLCLNATSTGETLSEVVRAYQGKGDLAGCILTKLDEAATIGGVLDIAVRQKLNVYYVASGQRVPEDLHVANKQYLVDRAFKLKRETSAFSLQDDELPMVMANAAMANAINPGALREVSLG
ncbi:flagellar biosynthesis protein FlhF [Undibacterium sp. RuTC16W]|uniref:flagellar biosynthesis protein FlhF n=1 Tax=Undibacterium sp. RuTC16W TaxID=3413048 RepID=UPI003BF344FB